MPDRLYVMTVGFNRNWLTTAADRDGVGLKTEQFTTKMSTCKAVPAWTHPLVTCTDPAFPVNAELSQPALRILALSVTASHLDQLLPG